MRLSLVVPSPSWPASFLPQHQTAPVMSSAHEKLSPAVTCFAPVTPVTCTGTLLSITVPTPSSPLRFAPQHHTVPSFLTAHVWSPPAAIAPAQAGASGC